MIMDNKMFTDFFSRNKYVIFYVFVACVIYIMPIALTDRYFIDDLGRSSLGYYNWSGNGRPFADLVMMLLGGFSIYNIDISPIPLIISITLYSVTSVAYIKSINNDLSCFATTIASMGFIINPFFLENLSYKYDALPMMISISSIMLAFIGNKKGYVTFILGVVLLLISLSSYQASIGFFICLSVIEFLVVFCRTNENAVITTAKRITQLAIGYLVYSQVIQRIFIPISNGYTIKHSELLPLTKDGALIFERNAGIFTDTITSYFSSIPAWMLSMIAVSIVSSIILSIISSRRKLEYKNILCFAIVLLSPVLIIIFSTLHLLALKVPITDPRVLTSFSAFSFFMLSSWIIHRKYKRFFITVSIVYLVFSYTYSFAYGNALKSLDQYENYIASSIASDVKEIDPTSNLKIQTIGYMDYPPQTAMAIKRFPSLKRLLPRYLNNDWYWAFFKLAEFGVKNKRARIPLSQVAKLSGMKVMVVRDDYEISSNKDVLLVKLKGMQ